MPARKQPRQPSERRPPKNWPSPFRGQSRLFFYGGRPQLGQRRFYLRTQRLSLNRARSQISRNRKSRFRGTLMQARAFGLTQANGDAGSAKIAVIYILRYPIRLRGQTFVNWYRWPWLQTVATCRLVPRVRAQRPLIAQRHDIVAQIVLAPFVRRGRFFTDRRRERGQHSSKVRWDGGIATLRRCLHATEHTPSDTRSPENLLIQRSRYFQFRSGLLAIPIWHGPRRPGAPLRLDRLRNPTARVESARAVAAFD